MDKNLKIGILIMATGNYKIFLDKLIESARKYFMVNHNVIFYVFSDERYDSVNIKIINIKIDHLPYPLSTLLRYSKFIKYKYLIEKTDYLFYTDADTLFVDKITDEEVLGNLVAVQHCGYVNRIGTYETNPNSTAYVNPSKYKIYFGGGFNGGKTSEFLKMSDVISKMINADLRENYIAVWHDESYLNRYLIDNPPTKILSPSYHYPESNIKYYEEIWKPNNYTPKILLLDKSEQFLKTHNKII